MFSRLKIGSRILFAILFTAVLAAVISALGIMGVRSIERSMAASTTTVRDRLSRQNQQLEEKSHLAKLMVSLSEATSTEQLDKVVRDGASVLDLTSNGAGKSAA